MFKGIRNIIQKTSSDNKVAPPNEGRLPVLKAKFLLASERYQLLIKKLPYVLNLDTLQFDNHCANLINNFAEFVQQLPETQNGYFCRLGGMLEHGLHRASLSATLCRAYFLPKESDFSDHLTQTQILWTYAVFSAGLLHDIGKLVVSLSVQIKDRYHKNLQPWNPWEGSMVGVATEYEYSFSELNLDEFRRRTTLILARQLMSTHTFLWLASDPDVFSAWLAMLEDDDRDGGMIGELVRFADAQITRANLLGLPLGATVFDIDALLAHDSMLQELEKNQQEAEKDAHKNEKKQNFMLADLAKMRGGEQDFAAAALKSANSGRDFLRWLTAAIADGTLKANSTQSGVFRVNEGVLLSAQIFEKYLASQQKDIKNSDNVANALAKLAIHEANPDKSIWHQYSHKDGNIIKGILIRNVNLIFPFALTPEILQSFMKIPFAAIAASTDVAKTISQVAERVTEFQSKLQQDAPSAAAKTNVPPKR